MPKLDENYFNVDANTAIKQNTIEDVLEEGENILLRLKPDHKDYVLEAIFKGLPFVLLWAAIDTFIIVMMATTGAFQQIGGFFVFAVIAFFALHLMPVWLYVAGIIKRVHGYKNIEYVLTDKRIIVRSGIIGIDFKIIYYSEIQSIDVKVGLWDRLFKVGDVIIKTASQTAMLEDIQKPYQYATKIQKVVQDIKTDIQYPNGLRPDTNPGYNTTYDPK